MERRTAIRRLIQLLAGGGAAWSASGCRRETPVREADGRIPIEFWHQPRIIPVPGREHVAAEAGDFERYLAEQFMRRRPDVVVRTQSLNWEDLPRKVPISVIAGAPPDLLQDFIGRTSGYWHQGVLEPLDEVIAGDRQDFQSDYLDEFTLDGRLHAVPLYSFTQMLAINRAAWTRIGRADLLPTAEQPQWTVDQFETALRAVARPGKTYPLGMQVSSEQGDYAVLQFFWSFGAEVYAHRDYGRVAINSPAGVRALRWLTRIHREGLIQPNVTSISAAELNTMFWRGGIVCIPSGPGHITAYELARRDGRVTTEMDLILTLPPAVAGVPVSLAHGGGGLAVFRQRDARKRAAVMDFARFLVRPEVIARYSEASKCVPARKSVEKIFADDRVMSRVLEQTRTCRHADMGLTSPHYYDLRKRLPPQLQFAFLGLKTPAAALADFEREAAAVLAGASGG